MPRKLSSVDLFRALCNQDIELEWCGDDGLFQQAADEISQLRAALVDVRELIEGYVDINNSGGPNDAMQATQIIEEALR